MESRRQLDQVHFVRPVSTQRPWRSEPYKYNNGSGGTQGSSRSSSSNYYAQKYMQQQRESMYKDHILELEDAQKDKRARRWKVDFKDRQPGRMSLTGRLIWLNIAAYAVQVLRPSFTAWGIKRSDLILQGRELYRVLTPVFLHGGIGHLGTNMYSLSNVGPDVEKIFGKGRYIYTYLLAGIAGNIFSAYRSPNPALGASGAVFGVIGAYAVFLSRNEWLLGSMGESMSNRLVQTMGMNVALGFVNPRIDNWGHIGGALGGAFMAYWVGPRLYLTELPNGGRMIVDRPLVRLPRSIESIPENIGNLMDRMTTRIRVDRYMQDRPPPPWQERQRRKPRVPNNRSIKPKEF